MKSTIIKKTLMVIIITIVILSFTSSTGCLFDTPNSPEKEWYTPRIIAYFNTINLLSFAENLTKNNISNDHFKDHYREGYSEELYLDFPDNSTYFFSNKKYNISATGVGFHDQSSFGGRIWLSMGLDDMQYEKYRFPSENDAFNSSYLLEPSFELIKYFLNESGNSQPYNVRFLS